MNFSDLMSEIKTLSKTQLHQLYEFIIQEQNINNQTDNTLTESRYNSGIFCPKCGSTENIQKFGKDANGKQRYRCKDCGRIFTHTSNTIFEGTRKDYSVWTQYIDCMLLGLTIHETAKICGIANSTAFAWRHKILRALSAKREKETKLKGVVEADETFFAISYKGAKELPEGRKARHSGLKSKKRGISKDKVCVPCAIDRSGNTVSKICNLGRISVSQLVKFYEGKVEENATFCTDSERGYIGFSRANGYKHVRILGGKGVQGVYHLGHINAMHSNIKTFVRRFKGVSTKHLNNYLTWQTILKSESETILHDVIQLTMQESYKNIANHPAIPTIEEAA